MTTAEKKDWIKQRASEKAEGFAAVHGADAPRRAKRAERKRMQNEVKAEFQEEFGIGWLAILPWLPTIWSIVAAILKARFGEATE